jgi:TonB family protein
MRRILTAATLLSPLILSAAALASQPVTDDSTSTPARPLSTGVKQAHILYAPEITIPAFASLPENAEFVLHLNVSQDGKAEDVQILKSASANLDAPVAAAVRQFRFRPATLDKQPVATDMTLTVVVPH